MYQRIQNNFIHRLLNFVAYSEYKSRRTESNLKRCGVRSRMIDTSLSSGSLSLQPAYILVRRSILRNKREPFCYSESQLADQLCLILAETGKIRSSNPNIVVLLPNFHLADRARSVISGSDSAQRRSNYRLTGSFLCTCI